MNKLYLNLKKHYKKRIEKRHFVLMEEIKDYGTKNVVVFDIDDTLLTAQNIFIHRKLPTDKEVVKLTPQEFAHEKITQESKQYYSYDEFCDEKKVYGSIVDGIPLVKNLRILDANLRANYELMILTARGMEDVIYKALKKWLMYIDVDGEFKNIGDKLKRENVFAINDKKGYVGATDFEKKSNVLKEIAKEYDLVKFIDDDKKNINAVKDMNIKNIQVISAWGE